MRGNIARRYVPGRIASVAVLAVSFLLIATAPAGATLTDSFVTSGNAHARWINETAAPPGATETQSIELAVHAKSIVDFNDAAWVRFEGFDSAPPATPPSFAYKISQTGASGGSVRLVIRFSDGGLGFLRPETLTANVWSFANGATRSWESTGGQPCGTSLSYAEMLACHPGTTVTSLEVINDSGWLYNGRFVALIDSISYGGELVTKPAPPVLGKSVQVKRVSGNVKVRLPDRGPGAAGKSNLDTVDGLVQGLPVGSRVDARRGTIRVIARRGSRGRLQSGKFAGSAFTVGQSRRRSRRGLTTLRLKTASRARCTTGSASRSSTGKPVKQSARRRRRGLLRRLRGNARGRFRTRGRYSSAAVVGTRWSISDRCEGTLVTVKKGKVTVRDFRRNRTITLRSGQSYLARAPGY